MSAILDFLNLLANIMSQQERWVVLILPAALLLFITALIVVRRDTPIGNAFLMTGVWWSVAAAANIIGFKISLDEVFIVTILSSIFVIWTSIKMQPPESKPKPPKKPS